VSDTFETCSSASKISKKLGISPDKRGEKVMRDLFWKRGEFARYKAFEQQLNDMQIPAPQRQEAVA